MKKLILIFILLYATFALADEYVRSIRVASFYTVEQAQKAISSIEKLSLDFDDCSENIVYRVRKIGHYYVLLVEPFKNKLLLQGTLDKIRVQYPDAYVSRYKKTDVNIPFTLVVNKEKNRENLIETPEKETPPKVIIKEVEKIKTITKVVVKKEYIESQYKMLFYFIFALFIVMLLLYILKSTKKNDTIDIKDEKKSLSAVDEQEEIFDDDLSDMDELDIDDTDIEFEDTIDAVDLLGETRDILAVIIPSSSTTVDSKIEEIVENSQKSIRKIEQYASQKREKELVEEILKLKSLSETLALYVDATIIESMKSERVIKEVEKIQILIDNFSSTTKSSQTKSS